MPGLVWGQTPHYLAGSCVQQTGWSLLWHRMKPILQETAGLVFMTSIFVSCSDHAGRQQIQKEGRVVLQFLHGRGSISNIQVNHHSIWRCIFPYFLSYWIKLMQNSEWKWVKFVFPTKVCEVLTWTLMTHPKGENRVRRSSTVKTECRHA